MKIFFKFSGGPWDGKLLEGQLGGDDEAQRYYALSYHGRVGQRFRTASQYTIDTLADEGLQADSPRHFQQHIYEVVHRLESDKALRVWATYVESRKG